MLALNIYIVLLVTYQHSLVCCGSYFGLTLNLSAQICADVEDKTPGKVVDAKNFSIEGCAVVRWEGQRWGMYNCAQSDDYVNSLSEDHVTKSFHPSTEAKPHSHPYLVYVKGDSPSESFSGTIFNDHTIITTIKPFMDIVDRYPENFREVLRFQIGKHNISKKENEDQLRFMCDYTLYPPSGGTQKPYIAFIHLYDQITYNEYVWSTSLAQANVTPSLQGLTVPAWGSDENDNYPNVLQEAYINVENCTRNHEGPLIYCTKDASLFFHGDMGTPLLYSDKNRIYDLGVSGGDTRRNSTYFIGINTNHFHSWLKTELPKGSKKCLPKEDYSRDEFALME